MEAREEAGGARLLWDRPWPRRAVVVVVIAAHFLLLFFSVSDKSATSDEPFHISRGVSALYSGDFRMSVAHPPLINLISATPLLFLPEVYKPFNDSSWRHPGADPTWRKQQFAKFLLWRLNSPFMNPRINGLDIIFWCRIPTMVLSAVLALILYLWTKRLMGPGPALAALTLYCFSPTIIAHSRLITTDTGCALLILLFAISLHRLVEKKTWAALALCGIAFGLAQLAKYTSILLVPMVPVTLILADRGSVRERLTRFFEPRPGRAAFKTGAAGWIIIMAIGLLVIWAGFLFETESIHEFEVPETVSIAERPGAFLKGAFVRTIARLPLVPRTYYYGLSRTMIDTAGHSLPLYFLGERSEGGWWYYYPVMFGSRSPPRSCPGKGPSPEPPASSARW